MSYAPHTTTARGSAQALQDEQGDHWLQENLPPYYDPGYGDIFTTLRQIHHDQTLVDRLPPASEDWITGVIAKVMRNAPAEKVRFYAWAFLRIKVWQERDCSELQVQRIIDILLEPTLADDRADIGDQEFLSAALELIIHHVGLSPEHHVPVSLFERLHQEYDMSRWITEAFNTDLARTVLCQEDIMAYSPTEQICDRIRGVARLAAELYLLDAYTSPLAAVGILRIVLESSNVITEDDFVSAAADILTSCPLQLRRWIQRGDFNYESMDARHRYFYRHGPQREMDSVAVDQDGGLHESRWAFRREAIMLTMDEDDEAWTQVFDSIEAAEAQFPVDGSQVPRNVWVAGMIHRLSRDPPARDSRETADQTWHDKSYEMMGYDPRRDY